jgi:hypothetical protein
MSIDNAFNGIAGQTYRQKSNSILKTIPSTGISVLGSSTAITHNLGANPNGLHFGIDEESLIPSALQTASLDLTINMNSSDIVDSVTGGNKLITVKHFIRNFGSSNAFLEEGTGTDISVGRFVNRGSITDSTVAIEHFFDEVYRWDKDTLETNRNISQAGGSSYWTNTSNANYNSNQSILNTQDMQVHYTGELRYPENTYPSNLPNVADYLSATGDRFYYRAFDIGSGTAGVKAIKITLFYDGSNPLQLNDFVSGEEIVLNNGTAFTPTAFGTDDTPIRIDICLPGPIAPGGTNSGPNPGTKWGCMTTLDPDGASGITIDDWNVLSIGDARYVVLEENQTGGEEVFGTNHTAPNNAFTILCGLGATNLRFTQGVLLCRVRFKSSATNVRHVITQLKIEPIT